jgi:large subunit ribosomal protein L18
MKVSRNKLRLHRKKRVRAKISGTSTRPRLAIFKSLRGIFVQIIDDESKKTLTCASSKDAKAANSMIGAKEVGKNIAEKCLKEKIEEVVFDRSGYKYHGKIKALAEGAREGGLKF